jgi:hypothetical protein
MPVLRMIRWFYCVMISDTVKRWQIALGPAGPDQEYFAHTGRLPN